MTNALSNPYLAAWDASLAARAAYARRISGKLSAASMAQRPSWGGWSVSEIFEHRCMTDGLDLRRPRLSSPAARVIRLNAGDAFAVLAVHAERHMGQVRRTIVDVAGAVAVTDRA